MRGNVGQVNYAASKAGIQVTVRTVSSEMHRHGVRVNALAPNGYTQMTETVLGEHRPYTREQNAVVVVDDVDVELVAAQHLLPIEESRPVSGTAAATVISAVVTAAAERRTAGQLAHSERARCADCLQVRPPREGFIESAPGI
ncbi:SDR family NAD(P)-dependent oxidoreductase [Halostagnicola kamekurae]|uniref:SDR family NAD(P)-dependent oxidoreductase n=1 Tax=Halostagnicola kamekurae TaxID=619731 RepID=UPI000A78BFCF|nr:SDR family NAD(P)-dependent oxidoreductase [Halostagnicola kamekurae]